MGLSGSVINLRLDRVPATLKTTGCHRSMASGGGKGETGVNAEKIRPPAVAAPSRVFADRPPTLSRGRCAHRSGFRSIWNCKENDP